MSDNYYDKEYYSNCCGTDYKDTEQWETFFSGIADKIISQYAPKTVLEMGCASGYLLSALRERGVEAFGIDISEYAISNVLKEYKDFVNCQSAVEKLPSHFPQRYDMVISIEMIEHIYEEEALKVIAKMCEYSDIILLTSSSNDYTEKTHFNVQQPEYWVKQFAKHGFFNNPYKRPTYITKDSFCFYKTENMCRVVEDYERSLKLSSIEIEKNLTLINEANLKIVEEVEKNQVNINNVIAQKDEDLQKILLEKDENLKNVLSEKNEELQKVLLKKNDLSNVLAEFNFLKTENENLKAHVSILDFTHNQVVNSKTWKFTWPLRRILSEFKKTKSNDTHKDLVLLNDVERKAQEAFEFDKKIKFSIVVPLYNTPKEFLEDMLTSVKRQTYSNWEICLADGSDLNNKHVKKICKKYARFDKRFKYKKLKENLGISENTNVALSMAKGDYIAMFDHDDYLHPSALFYYMKEIQKNSPDVLYCDEVTFKNTFDNITVIHHKPELAIDNLRANNYICHFLVVKRNIIEKVGNFNKEFDGSQDHDFVLRLTEETENFVRIPKVLYYWRAHEGSVAESTGAKNYAADAGKKAVIAHLNRLGISAQIESSKVSASIYKLKYNLKQMPLVSIVIPNKDQKDILKICVDSILNKTTYKNYEIIIVENNSVDEETFKYYDYLKNNDKVKIVYYSGIFNYSLICNFGFTYAKGEQILMLNNDVEVITPDWIQEMLMYNQRENVAVTGAMLYYPNDTVQHAGVVLGIGGVAGHSHKYFARGNSGYMGRLAFAQNYSAVTAACMMIKRSVFEDLSGFCEDFKVAFNDVDFCMRVREKGYLICWTPYAELYHYESISRGDDNNSENIERFQGEIRLFLERWDDKILKNDPYYNPNLTMINGDFSVK